MFVKMASLLCTLIPRNDIDKTSSKERREGQITTSEEETQLQGFA